MVIEWLKFRMAPENREAFIAADTEVWTPALQTYPGFVSKETWIDPNEAESVVFMIRWTNREQWKSVSEADLDRVTQQFDQAFGYPYDMVESKEYQVRRFPIPG